jgi:hypothetical protein
MKGGEIMIKLKKLRVAVLLSLAVGAGAYGVVQSSTAEACCCDFSDGRIVCTITGEELASCCCK